MKMLKSLYPIFFLCCFLSACASSTLKLPQSRFHPPETLGGNLSEREWSVESGVSSSISLQPIGDPSVRPLDLNQIPIVSSDAGIHVKTDLSLASWADTYFRVGNDSEPAQLGLVLQLLGPSRKESTKGSFSFATSFGYGRSTIKYEGLDDSTDQTDELFPWKARSELEIANVAMIFGYRPWASSLIYGGPYASLYRYNLYITHEESSEGTDSRTTYQDTGEARTYGFHLGLEMAVATLSFLTFEWEYVDATIQEDDHKNWSFVSGSIGTRF